MRYDGRHSLHHLDEEGSAIIQAWQNQGWVLSLCPEVSGGLPVPRWPAEIQNQKIINSQGQDVSAFFHRGAEKALAACLKHGIAIAVLKQGSPSCGSGHIHDGSFTQRKIDGQGMTTRLLQEHGIMVFDEKHLMQADVWLKKRLG